MLLNAIFLQDLVTLPWDKIFNGGISFVILVILLVVVMKLAPTWKEVKLKEIDGRDIDAKARIRQSDALESVAKVLYEVAVEQRRASDSVKILQRVNSTKAEDLEAAISEAIESHEQRLIQLEKVDATTNRATAEPAAAH